MSRRRPLLALLVIALVAALSVPCNVAAETWAEKLGYPAGRKVLILHADDIGMCYEANQAAKHYLPSGSIQSAALMVPCPWFNEAAAWYKENPDLCVGLHLAMNSEWKHYRWGPVAPPAEVSGMIDADGYLWRATMQTALNAKPSEIEAEVRAQIERALAAGIQPSHVDTHMGTLYARPAFAAAYMKVAQEFGIPAMVIELTPRIAEKFRKQGYPDMSEIAKISAAYPFPKLDDFDAVPGGDTYEEKRDNFFQLVRSLEPGITEIIFHPSVETEGLKRITNSWQQRVWEAELFDDPTVQKFFEREEIIFTNWKEMLVRFKERSGPAVKAGSD